VRQIPKDAHASVFMDPTGRRWRHLRSAGLLGLCACLALLTVTVVQVHRAPELEGKPEPRAVTAADVGDRPPVIGEGPLVQVVRLQQRPRSSVVDGFDPFTGRRLSTLSTAEVAQAGHAGYAIQRFGYSRSATRTISLSFDDGPDPVWTPRLLDVLSQEHVPATFFVTGVMAARYPEIVEREGREGHAVANHSLTHTDVASAPDWRVRLELVLTDRVLRSITGQRAAYFRLPYEGDDVASTQDTLDGLLRSQQLGYLVTSHDFDTNDWEYDARRAKAGSIPFPPLDGQNITMLMHDGGGNGRAGTVEYVKRLIPYARANGYTFQTMPQVQPTLQARIGTVTPTIWDRATLAGVQAVYAWPNKAVHALFLFALFAVAVWGAMNAALAAWHRRRRTRMVRHFKAAGSTAEPPRVSVLLAAYNEEKVIERTVRSLLASTCPMLELIVVDDGSQDDTAGIVGALAATDPRVLLVRQENTGKAEALNRGLAHARGDVVATFDADTIVAPDTVGNLVRHFSMDAGGTLGAVAGVVRVGNRDRNLLTRWQALEYLTQIGVDRSAQDVLGAITIIPGACAAWRRQAVLDVGGYSGTTLAEDCDLTLSLHAAGWRVLQDNEAFAYTEAPETVDALLQQRIRWTFGTLQAIYLHRNMLFRLRHGLLGMVILPWYIVSVVVPIVTLPIVATMAVVAVQAQGWRVLVVYFLLFMATHLVLAAVGVLLMRERPNHLVMVPIYRLVHEPLRAYLLYTSLFLALRGVRLGWNKLQRTGTVDRELGSSFVLEVSNALR
jgi:peptidoglycan-N-acetylglucosamine deacetylase